MNRGLTAMMLAIGLSLVGQAFGQSALPSSVRSATTVTDEGRSLIVAFQKAQIAKMTGTSIKAKDERSAIGDPYKFQGPSISYFLTFFNSRFSDKVLPLYGVPYCRLILFDARLVCDTLTDNPSRN